MEMWFPGRGDEGDGSWGILSLGQYTEAEEI